MILLYYSPFIDQGCLAKIIDGWIFGGGKLNLGIVKSFSILTNLDTCSIMNLMCNYHFPSFNLCCFSFHA